MKTAMGALIVVAALLGLTAPAPEPSSGHRMIEPPGEQVEAIGRRIRVKEEVVSRLIGREVTLVEAARLFRAIDRMVGLPGHDRLSSGCRAVIDWVSARLDRPDAPPSAAECVARLEAELAGLSAADGWDDADPSCILSPFACPGTVRGQ